MLKNKKRRSKRSLRPESLESRMMLHGGADHGVGQDFGVFQTVLDDDNVLSLVMPDQHYSLDLKHAMTFGVRDIDAIQLSYSAPNHIKLDSSTAAVLATQRAELDIKADADDTVELDGPWELMGAERGIEEYSFFVSDGTTQLSLTNGTPWRNPISAVDVSGDGEVQPRDALIVINSLSEGSRPLNVPNAAPTVWELVDVTGDNSLTPQDALLVINSLLADGSHSVCTEPHDHHMPLEVEDTDNLPTIALSSEPAANGGWNVHVDIENFQIDTTNVSMHHVAGHGHMHLYINGERIGRLYNQSFYVPSLPEGTHDVRVELSANTHATYVHNGVPIDDTIQLTSAGPNTGDNSTQSTLFTGNRPVVELQATADPHGGWNVYLDTENFQFTDDYLTNPDGGDGIAYLEIDGIAITRLYGPWFHLGSLPEGMYELRVVLADPTGLRLNDNGGKLLEGFTMLHVTADSGGHSHDDGSMGDDGHTHNAATGDGHSHG